MDALLNLPTASAPESFDLPRLRAERLGQSHRYALRRMDSNPRLMATLGGPRTAADTDAYLARNLAHWDEHGFGIWILRDPLSGEVLGRAGLRHLAVHGVDEIELAFALLPDFWGRGLATEAARACLTIGRDWMNLPSVVALTLPGNLASQRVLRKSALTLEREVVHAGAPHLLFRSD